MTVTVSPLVLRDDAIASVDDLWEPSSLFLPNWQRDVRLNTSYRTIFQSSRSQAEQRYILAEKPRRSMTYALRSYTPADSERVRAFMSRASRARVPMPIWPDITIAGGRLAVSTNIYPGDYRDRRFQIGARMCALVETEAGISTNFKYAKVVAVSDTQLQIDTDLNETYDNGLGLRFESFIVLDPLSRFIWTTQQALGFGPGPRSPFHAGQVGDIVIVCFAFTTFPAVSTPISVTGIEAVDSDDSSHTAVIVPVVTLEHPGDPGDSAFRPKTMVVGFWRIPESFRNKGFHIEFTTDGDQLIAPHIATTVWKNAIALTSPLHQATGTISAAPDLQNVAVTVDPDIAKNRIISFHFTGVADRDFVSHSPVAAREMWNQSLGGNQDTTFLVLEHEAVDGSSVAMIGTLDSPGASELEGYLAAAVVLQQKEDPGLSTGLFFPVMECDLELDNIAKTITDSVNDSEITFIETPGVSTLDPEITPGTTPAGYDSYDPGNGTAYPILHLPIDWSGVQTGTFRVGKRDRVGITTTIQVFGSNPGALFNLPFFGTDRETAFNVLEFFDSRGGRAFPFWLFSPSPILKILTISVSGSTLTLDANVNERDWELYKYLGVVDSTTGVRSVHNINTATEVSGIITLTIFPLLPDDVVSRYEFTTAHLCRIDKDGFDERWLTNAVQKVSLPCRELINEDTFPVVLEDLCGVGGGAAWLPDNICDECVDLRCGSTDPFPECCVCTTTATAVVTCYDSDCDDSCSHLPCETVTAHKLVLLFESCGVIGPGIIRWLRTLPGGTGGFTDVWVDLDTTTGVWSTHLVFWIMNLPCSGFSGGGGGPCCPDVSCLEFLDDFPPIITHDCIEGYSEQHVCGLLSSPCEYRKTLGVTAAGAAYGSALCS